MVNHRAALRRTTLTVYLPANVPQEQVERTLERIGGQQVRVFKPVGTEYAPACGQAHEGDQPLAWRWAQGAWWCAPCAVSAGVL